MNKIIGAAVLVANITAASAVETGANRTALYHGQSATAQARIAGLSVWERS